MEYLTALLDGLVENQQISEWGVFSLVMGSAFIGLFAFMLLFSAIFDPVRSRFLSENNEHVPLSSQQKRFEKKIRAHNQIFMPSDQALLGRTVTRLHHAGYHANNSLLYFYAIRLMLMLALPSITLIVLSLIPGVSMKWVIICLTFAVTIGYVGPSFTLDKIISRRQKNIRRAFPDALDLLVVCAEAGMALEAAIQKVASEISMSQPVLAEELSLVIAETRAGVDRNRALKNLADRTGVEDIKGLVATLAQSMRFGTSIGETLRVYSEDFRDKRMQAAEEQAAKIGVKLIFPLALCFLPIFLLIVVGPVMLALTGVFNQIG